MSIVLTADQFGPLRIWAEPDEERSYVIGVDSCGGSTASDWAVAIVLDARSGEDVAAWRGHVDPADLGQVVAWLAEYYRGKEGQAYVVPEVNAHGIATLERMRQAGVWNIYTRMAWDRVQRDWTEVQGWLTTLKSRPILIARAQEALRNPDIRINNPIILHEASTWIRNESGKEEPMSGCHDDALIAWMLALEGRARLGMAPDTPQKPPQRSEETSRREQCQWVWEKTREVLSGPRYVRWEDEGW